MSTSWLGLRSGITACLTALALSACDGTSQQVARRSGSGGSFGGSPVRAGNGAGTPTQVILNDAEICDAQAYLGDRRRLDIYMMVDDSGSMVPYWLQTIDAINMFFRDPASAGIGVGVSFFGSSCESSSYAQPRVPISPLPGNLSQLEQAFPAIPIEGTATLPALQGAIQHARSWAATNPEAQVVVLLVTDGLPTECGSTVENVTETAREGFAGAASVKTFVVGIGDIGALNAFAAAGGTDKALITQPGAAQELVRALNNIRSAALPCDFKLPTEAGLVQTDRVNLRHTAADGTETTIGAVRDHASCDLQRGGWYFDSLATPTRVIACETSCRQLNSQGGEVKILLGCPSIVPS